MLRHRWVYYSGNLLVDANVAELQSLMRRAQKDGYNGVVLADYKLNLLDSVGPAYFGNARKVIATARDLGLDLYPSIFPIGYSNGLLAHNPNLAEGPPLRDVVYRVQGAQAVLVPDPDATLKNGSFEQSVGDKLSGWDMQDYPGTATFIDRSVHHGDGRSLRMEGIGAADPQYGHARISQVVPVRPYHQYRLSVWVKTDGFQTPGDTKALALTPSGSSLLFTQWDLERTQDWKQYQMVFNSLGNRQVRVYLGVWGGKGGRIWWDDARLEDVGLLNVLRRPGCPLTVKGDDGTVYAEGRDLQPIKDDKLGRVPWAGEYNVAHQPPVLRLASNSRLRDGQRLHVSAYHAVVIHSDQVTCCLSEPEVYSLLRDQVRRVNALFRPKSFFMSHDEIRVANWCEACQKRGLTPGQLLADNARRCVDLVHEVSPAADVYVWSDMFDPNHNAHGDYYLVNGSWSGSWEGLPKQVTVANWYFEERKRSLPWFGQRGHSQILAGYYDSDPSRIRTWLRDASGVPGIVGVMYTTWAHNYSDLEAFARAAWGDKVVTSSPQPRTPISGPGGRDAGTGR